MWLYWLKGLFDKKSMNMDEKKKKSKNKIKNKIKTPKHWVFQKVLFHEKVKQNINILNAGKESDL